MLSNLNDEFKINIFKLTNFSVIIFL